MRKNTRAQSQGDRGSSDAEAGFSLIEMMFASVVMTIGLTGTLVLIVAGIANDSRSKNDSSGTVLAQAVVEMIASVPANATATTTPSSNLTIVDCNPTTSSASHTINALGSSGGAGAPLTSGGVIDFTQPAVTGYSMSYYGCQASTGDRQKLYDVRWYIKTISASAKLVVVAALPLSGDKHSNFVAVPVSLRTIVGL